jgi:hypothetical protein
MGASRAEWDVRTPRARRGGGGGGGFPFPELTPHHMRGD